MMVFWVFVGWFIFVVYGGIGLIALPLDMILGYFHRPRPRSAREIAERKVMLRTRAQELMTYVENLKDLQEDQAESGGRGFFSNWSEKRAMKKKENQLKREMIKLEKEHEIFEIEQNLSANPVTIFLNLLLGCLFMVFSFMILIQIFFYKIIIIDGKPKSEFLNDLFIWVEFNLARVFSTALLTGLSVYMLLTVMKGNIKFGMRFLLFIPIHEMKVGRTYINSFLFNLAFFMLCTPAIVHFIVDLLEAYVRASSSAFLFTVLIRRMSFFSFFYKNKIFLYVYLFWGLITFIYLMCKPHNDRLDVKRMLEERKKIAKA